MAISEPIAVSESQLFDKQIVSGPQIVSVPQMVSGPHMQISSILESPLQTLFVHNTSLPTSFLISHRTRTLREELRYRGLGVQFIDLNLHLSQKRSVKKPKLIRKKNVENQNPKSLRWIIRSVEQEFNIPKDLLLCIAKVETGVRAYAVNYQGRGIIFRSMNDAVAFAKCLVRNGCSNFSVGCFQLHYRSHIRNFRSLEDMFNPEKNVRYAAKLLKNLYQTYGYNWEYAVKRYHSGYEASNCIYYTKIVNNLGRRV